MSEDELLNIITEQGRKLTALEELVDRLKILQARRQDATDNPYRVAYLEDEAKDVEKEIIELVLSWE
jgi:hypothetical protein